MLKRVEITNYKSIASADLKFGAQNVIVGPNGYGKSNLLDAMHFLRDASKDGLDEAVTKRHGIVSIRRWSKTRPYNIGIKLHFESKRGHGTYRVVISSGGGDFSVVEEEGYWTGESPFYVDKTDEHKTYSFLRTGSDPVQFDIEEFQSRFEKKITVPSSEMILTQFSSPSFLNEYAFFFSPLHDEISSCGAYSIYPNRIREPQSISRSEVLSDDGSNLASIIRQMRSSSHRPNKELLTTAMRQVLPILNEIRIESAGGFYVPVFRVREIDGGHSHDLNMSQISDGTLRMLGMLTAFYQPQAPKRITLEEPEQMIHPGLLPVLFEAMNDFLQFSQNQVFLTTHSPILLDMFEPEHIIGCVFEEGITRFSPMSLRQIDIVRKRLFSPGELLMAEGIIN